MSQEIGSPSTVPPAPSHSWREVWSNALMRPSVATYEGFANDPNGTSRRAYNWIFVSGLIVAVIVAFLQATEKPKGPLSPEEALSAGRASVGMICLVPATAAAGVLGFALVTGITQLVAKILGGSGTYSKLAYATAAYSAPLSLLTTALGAIPYVGYVTTPLGWIYGLVLNVIAVKAVNKFGWGKAIVPSAVLVVVGLILIVLWVVIVVIMQLSSAG